MPHHTLIGQKIYAKRGKQRRSKAATSISILLVKQELSLLGKVDLCPTLSFGDQRHRDFGQGWLTKNERAPKFFPKEAVLFGTKYKENQA